MLKPFSLELPKPLTIDCPTSGLLPDYKNITDYFKTLGTIPGQLKMQRFNFILQGIEALALKELDDAIKSIEEAIDTVTSIFPKVFQTIKNTEHEMEYKVREFMKEIDTFFTQKVLEILIRLMNAVGLGFLNPLNLPIPGLEGCIIADFFTTDGKVKIKGAIAKALATGVTNAAVKVLSVIYAGIGDVFNGVFGLNIPEYVAEEIWQYIMALISNILNIGMQAITTAFITGMAIVIPPIGAPLLGATIAQITLALSTKISLHLTFDVLWQAFKLAIEKAIQENFEKALKLISDTITDILSIPIPIFGTLGDIMGINPAEDLKRFKVHMLEHVLSAVKDAYYKIVEKIRQIMSMSIIELCWAFFKALGGKILKLFPIIKTIINILEIIVGVITGNIPVCTAMSVIFASVFNVNDIIYALLPKNNFNIGLSDFGFKGDLGEVIDAPTTYTPDKSPTSALEAAVAFSAQRGSDQLLAASSAGSSSSSVDASLDRRHVGVASVSGLSEDDAVYQTAGRSTKGRGLIVETNSVINIAKIDVTDDLLTIGEDLRCTETGYVSNVTSIAKYDNRWNLTVTASGAFVVDELVYQGSSTGMITAIDSLTNILTVRFTSNVFQSGVNLYSAVTGNNNQVLFAEFVA
jgi:hypothetical protein